MAYQVRIHSDARQAEDACDAACSGMRTENGRQEKAREGRETAGEAQLFMPEFSQQKKNFFAEITMSTLQPSPRPKLCDLVLVGLESGLPCHRKDCGCRIVAPTITLVGIVGLIVPHLHRSGDFFFSFP